MTQLYSENAVSSVLKCKFQSARQNVINYQAASIDENKKLRITHFIFKTIIDNYHKQYLQLIPKVTSHVFLLNINVAYVYRRMHFYNIYFINRIVRLT